MLAPLARIANQTGRNVMLRSIRNASQGGVPGENIPLDLTKKNMVTFHFFWFVGTGLAIPYLVMWHQLAKK